MSDYWTDQLAAHWGIAATLKPLEGEYDLNFLAHSDTCERYIFKVMRSNCDSDFVAMQIAALAHIQKLAPNLPFPKVLESQHGECLVGCTDADGNHRLLWLMEFLPGQSYAQSAHKSGALIADLGRALGTTDSALASFKHPALARDFKWNLTQSLWIEAKLDIISDPQRRALLERIIDGYKGQQAWLMSLPTQAVHNDVHDYNILVSTDISEPKRVTGLVDMGDMCIAPRICDLTITAAYVVLECSDPEVALSTLVAGYHSVNPLQPAEIDAIWALLQMRLAVSVVNSTVMAERHPEDPYVVITQAPAWKFLETQTIDENRLKARLRAACGLPVCDDATAIAAFLDSRRGQFNPLIDADLAQQPMGSLSVDQGRWPQNPLDMPLLEAARIGEEYSATSGIWLGYYAEPRLIYTSTAFRATSSPISNRRSVHLGVDIFAAAGTTVRAPLGGVVHAVENRRGQLDYGGLVVLAHTLPTGEVFFSLYGHLHPNLCDRLAVGQSIEAGQILGQLGNVDNNGGWAPHVHVQLVLCNLSEPGEWPGVADPDELFLWHQISPNPAALLNLADAKTAYTPIDKGQILQQRRGRFADNLKLSYSDPVMFMRGWRHYLFDEWGRGYLDAYNNVPHVGHAHPRIQAVAAEQLTKINCNSRYLHPARTAFAAKILSKMPPELDVCFFVNSGSEANELALRLARAHTGDRGIVTPDHGYFGNTTGAMSISAYKFNAPGGGGQPDWVELVDMPDDYRGRYRRDEPQRGRLYAEQVDGAIGRLGEKQISLAAFISETFPSVGGQIIPPADYLQQVYAKVRAAGGICIADEVQTGLGRLGNYYFGFEQQGVVPDAVVLGKPIGNGHPLAVVVTRRAIADSFAHGPEFFSTFGGSVLSCRTGHEVLDIIDQEDLQGNARLVGTRLLSGLRRLQEKYPTIGDVRGIGLFIGVDLVTDRDSRTENAPLADYIVNRLCEERVLIGTDGPRNNVLKIRPPLTIGARDVDQLIALLDTIFSEAAVNKVK